MHRPLLQIAFDFGQWALLLISFVRKYYSAEDTVLVMDALRRNWTFAISPGKIKDDGQNKTNTFFFEFYAVCPLKLFPTGKLFIATNYSAIMQHDLLYSFPDVKRQRQCYIQSA